jgi:CheY-like chemotaxis protein
MAGQRPGCEMAQCNQATTTCPPGAEGCAAVEERPDLVLVDLPFPRERRLEVLKRLGDAHPDAPVIAMPKPLTRDAFVAALRRAMNEVQ